MIEASMHGGSWHLIGGAPFFVRIISVSIGFYGFPFLYKDVISKKFVCPMESKLFNFTNRFDFLSQIIEFLWREFNYAKMVLVQIYHLIYCHKKCWKMCKIGRKIVILEMLIPHKIYIWSQFEVSDGHTRATVHVYLNACKVFDEMLQRAYTKPPTPHEQHDSHDRHRGLLSISDTYYFIIVKGYISKLGEPITPCARGARSNASQCLRVSGQCFKSMWPHDHTLTMMRLSRVVSVDLWLSGTASLAWAAQ